MRLRYSIGSIIVLAFLFAIVSPHAQQPAAPGGGRGQAPAGQVPAAGRGAPTAPPGINWPSPPLADGPILEDTGIVHDELLGDRQLADRAQR